MFVTWVIELVVDDILPDIIHLVGYAPSQELLDHFADLGMDMGTGKRGSGGSE
jgi:hypothetical protein